MALWLLLAAATAATDVSCPEGYIASPNASFRYPCWHLSPPNFWDFDSGSSFSSSLAACVEQCAENNAVPACFSSMEEIDWVTETWPLFINEGSSSVWSGVYKLDSSLPALDGWDHCVDGAVPFDAWDRCRGYSVAVAGRCPPEEQPVGYMCGGVYGGGFVHRACNFYGLDPVPCLCAGPATASPQFDADLVVLEAEAELFRALSQRTAATSFAWAVGLFLLPSYIVVIMRLVGCCVRRRDKTESRTELDVADRTKRRLAEHGEMAASARTRVSFTLFQIGLLIFAFAWTPMGTGMGSGVNPELGVGPGIAWLCLSSPGLFLMLLAIRPTDIIRTRITAAILFAISALMSAVMLLSNFLVGFYLPYVGYGVGSFIVCVALFRTLICGCCGRAGTVAARALRSLWLGARLFILLLAANSLYWIIEYGVIDDPNMQDCAAYISSPSSSQPS